MSDIAMFWASSSWKASSILKGGFFSPDFVILIFKFFCAVKYFSKIWTSVSSVKLQYQSSVASTVLIQCQLSSLFLFPVLFFLISLVWSLICKRSLGYCQTVPKIATLGYIIRKNLAVGEAEEQLEQYSCLFFTHLPHIFSLPPAVKLVVNACLRLLTNKWCN